MLLAPRLSHCAPEALLLCADAAAYCILAVLVALTTTDAAQATIICLTVSVASNAHRHIAARRAGCNQDATSEGQLRRLPAALTAHMARPQPATLWPWLPVLALVVASTIIVLANNNVLVGALSSAHEHALLALLGAEGHFIISRAHGDCRGGKPAPTLFVLMLHLAAALAGTPPDAALSLHRLLIVWTYFLTGVRKLYCVGPRWCDGKNLQLMCAIQGLYHDADASSGWNFILARHRRLCRVGSVAVVALQLALPLALIVAHPLAPLCGFALAMSFHAANHILWRINFFVAWCPALVALLVPGKQMTAHQLLHTPGVAAPACVLVLYLALQLGHALDLATEKALARCRAALLLAGSRGVLFEGLQLKRMSDDVTIRDACLGAIWLTEMHLLGDYYSSVSASQCARVPTHQHARTRM